MNGKNVHKYDDIINLPHHVSADHPQMPLLDRAAQFSPFAALTGHDAAIKETARITEPFLELDEDKKEQLDRQLLQIRKNLSERPKAEITYFEPDKRKNGGNYVTVRKKVKNIDVYGRHIIFEDGTEIPLEYLYAIEII